MPTNNIYYLTSWEDLTDDTIFVIFLQLDLFSLCRCSRISKRMLKLVDRALTKLWDECKYKYSNVSAPPFDQPFRSIVSQIGPILLYETFIIEDIFRLCNLVVYGHMTKDEDDSFTLTATKVLAGIKDLPELPFRLLKIFIIFPANKNFELPYSREGVWLLMARKSECIVLNKNVKPLSIREWKETVPPLENKYLALRTQKDLFEADINQNWGGNVIGVNISKKIITCRHPKTNKLIFEWELENNGIIKIVRETYNKSNTLDCIEFDKYGRFRHYCRTDREYCTVGIERMYDENGRICEERNYDNKGFAHGIHINYQTDQIQEYKKGCKAPVFDYEPDNLLDIYQEIEERGDDISPVQVFSSGGIATFKVDSLYYWIALLHVGNSLRRVSALLKHCFSLTQPLTVYSELKPSLKVVIHFNKKEVVRIDQPNWYLTTDM